MKNKIVLDIDILKDYDISINDFCALWLIYNEGKLDFKPDGIDWEELQTKRFIKIIKEDDRVEYILREKSITLIETEAKKSKKSPSKKKTSNIDVLTRMNEFRDIWKGLKAGSMGSPNACKEKLVKWLDDNPIYTFDDVLEAARLYIESLNGNYTYLQRADYFISKTDKNKVEESRLSAFVEEIGQDSQADWTTKLS